MNQFPETAIVIFITKYKSYFEYLFYHLRFKGEGCVYPEIGFGYTVLLLQPISHILRVFFAHMDYFIRNFAILNPYNNGFIKEELLKGRAALLYLVEKKGFYRRFVKAYPDPLQFLIEIQKSIDRPIYIVPHLMFFGKKPNRSVPNLSDLLFGTEEKPGRLRKGFILFNNPSTIFAEISEPVNLKKFIEVAEKKDPSPEILSATLRRKLQININRHRQSITGPVLKSLEEIKENILRNDRLQKFMEYYAKSRTLPLYKVRKKADACLEEIAAKYNLAVIKIGIIIVKWFSTTMFNGISVNYDMLNRAKNMSQKGPLILVPCHKSHFDYLVLSYILFQNNMPCPHIAAGKNLSFWPVGPLFRGAGAFFIRRSFSGAVVYAKVFGEYVQYLLEEGFNIEFFIEGGRSRTGKLLSPKLGFLSILLNAFKNGACEDMIFVPIYIGYDRVIEESSYVYEIEGGQKKPESLSQVFNARKFLKKRYGKIYVKFHEPISLKALLKQEGVTYTDLPSKTQNILCRKLGQRIINAINQVSVVTPHALVASAILNSSKKVFTYAQLLSNIDTYMNYLFSQEVKMADTLLLDRIYAIENAIDSYVQSKFIDRIPGNSGTNPAKLQFRVHENKGGILEYYKNNCVAHFIPAAYTALSILKIDAFQFTASDLFPHYEFLQDLFQHEFACDIDQPVEHFVRKNLNSFIDDAVLIPHTTLPDTYNLTSAGYRKLNFFANFLTVYFESYWIVLNFFMQYSKNSVNPKERFKKIQEIGNRMLKRKEIEREEALSKVNYENAVEFFTSHRIKGSDDNEGIESYTEALKKYMNRLPV
ncbi:MAG: 1-acyl-sn-glycerol-3-phosphate acyltransferase [Desulfobacterales bacterium]|nr:1-acyl-sn-glycerol-3-phosphate acyltransferase [Desulfobacterales bacterium]